MTSRLTLDPKWMAALGVLSAGLLLNEINIYAARHHMRWDLSAADRFTLSSETVRLVQALQEPITITIVRSADQESSVELRQTLASYEAQSPLIRVHELDPDRKPAELLALLHALEGGSDALTSDFASDAAMFVQSGTRTWLVRHHDLTEMDEEGRPLSTIEAAVTEAIAQVLVRTKLRICFVTGHGERSIDDESEEGLSELRRLLTRNNFEAERAPLDVAHPEDSLKGCEALALIAPDRPLPTAHAELLAETAKTKKALLVFVDPIVDRQARVGDAHLDALAPILGGSVRPAFVVETERDAVIPGSMGEVFFARARVHPITQGLTTDASRADARVVVSAASPLLLLETSSAQVVLESSANAVTMSALNTKKETQTAPFALPLAVAMTAPRDPEDSRRSLLVGTSSLVTNQAFRDPSQQGNRIFTENAFAWALARPSMVSVPARPLMSAGLALSEESLSALLRYVLLYLPLAALCLGATILLRRRRTEQRFREEREGGI